MSLSNPFTIDVCQDVYVMTDIFVQSNSKISSVTFYVVLQWEENMNININIY